MELGWSRPVSRQVDIVSGSTGPGRHEGGNNKKSLNTKRLDIMLGQ